MHRDYSDKAFKECEEWLEKKYRDKNYSLEELKMAGKQNDEELNSALLLYFLF